MLAVATVIAAQGCASTHAPPGAIPDPEASTRTARGGWVGIRMNHEGRAYRVYGELLAVGSDTVFVLAESGFRAIPRDSVASARLWAFDRGSMAGPVSAGVLVSLSHGLIFALTAPAWIIAGIVASSLRGAEATETSDRWDLEKLAAHARWPQGLPAVLDHSRLVLSPTGQDRERQGQ